MRLRVSAIVYVAAVLLASTTFAQVGQRGPIQGQPSDNAYGTVGESIVYIGAYDMFPMDGTSTHVLGSPRRYVSSGNGILFGGADIPNGALVTAVSFAGCNSHASAGLDAYVAICPNADPGGCTGGAFGVSVPPNTGCAVTRFDVPQFTANTVNNSYLAIWQPGAIDGSQNIEWIKVHYKRQVSPGPAVATFADVPTGHGFFKFVEALAAAGITGGCGGSNFCPDAPLTRGQMAVFLSAALGLHWPN